MLKGWWEALKAVWVRSPKVTHEEAGVKLHQESPVIDAMKASLTSEQQPTAVEQPVAKKPQKRRPAAKSKGKR